MSDEFYDSLILVSIDSLRVDALSRYNLESHVAPSINYLARHGTAFNRAVSHGGATPDAVPSILKSCNPPLIHPFDDISGYVQYVKRGPYLPKLLHDAGFATAAFHSNPFLSRLYGYDQGFDYFVDHLRADTKSATIYKLQHQILQLLKEKLPSSIGGKTFYLYESLIPPYLRGERVTDELLSWIRERKNDRFFAWIHYMDCHTPYAKLWHIGGGRTFTKLLRYASARWNLYFSGSWTQRDIDALWSFYLSAVNYVDRQIYRLITWLKQQKIHRKVLIVLTADHGDSFGENGWIHHTHVSEEVLRVPLIFYPLNHAVCTDSVVAHSDILPTVMNLLGFRHSGSDYTGISLLPSLNSSYPLKSCNRGILSASTDPKKGVRYLAYRERNWKYVRYMKYRLEPETIAFEGLYDLSRHDSEAQNLAPNFQTKLLELRSRIDEILPAVPTSKTVHLMTDDEEAIRNRLKLLGYE